MKKLIISAAVILLVCSACASPYVCEENTVIYERELVAMQDSTIITGHFYILGAGSISEKGVLRYIEKVPDGGSVMNTVKEGSAIIYDVAEGEKARVIRRLIDCNTSDTDECLKLCGYQPYTLNDPLGDYGYVLWYEFYVPKGTFVQKFSVDLK